MESITLKVNAGYRGHSVPALVFIRENAAELTEVREGCAKPDIRFEFFIRTKVVPGAGMSALRAEGESPLGDFFNSLVARACAWPRGLLRLKKLKNPQEASLSFFEFFEAK